MPQGMRFDQYIQPLKIEKLGKELAANRTAFNICTGYTYILYIQGFPFLHLFGLPLQPRSAAEGAKLLLRLSPAPISIGFYFIGHKANSFRKLFKRSDSWFIVNDQSGIWQLCRMESIKTRTQTKPTIEMRITAWVALILANFKRQTRITNTHAPGHICR